MLYTPLTSFRRPIDAVQIKHQRQARETQPERGVNKWTVLKDLTTARKYFGLSDRPIAVLQALLSFHRETILSGENLVVFPSNASICERLGGMPCSTMRRHLLALVTAGLVVRRDSPNGKRYVKRYRDTAQAFGFDLSPLVTRANQIAAAAEDARAQEEQLAQLRQAISLMKRDLIGLEGYARQSAPDVTRWDAFSDLLVLTDRSLRRALNLTELSAIFDALKQALSELHKLLNTEDLSTNPPQNEQHIQTSIKESLDKKETEAGQIGPKATPLHFVLEHCREFQCYLDSPVQNEGGLIDAAETVRPMIGISNVVWSETISRLGKRPAAIVVLAMLEKFSEIRVPDAYLRAINKKAMVGRFDCRRFVLGLSRQNGKSSQL